MSDTELTAEEFAQLKKENSKLKLEANLRRSLSTQLEKQKRIADEAKQEALEKSAELEVLSAKLARYLSPQIYEQIFSGNQDADVTSQRKKLTVFFSDIVGFTDITEHLESEELTSLINFYLNEMSTIALKYGGTIDKYIGDAILIFFGGLTHVYSHIQKYIAGLKQTLIEYPAQKYIFEGDEEDRKSLHNKGAHTLTACTALKR